MSKRRRTLAVVGTALAVAGGFGASRYVSGGADEAEALGEQQAITLISEGVAHLEATTITYDQWLRRNYPAGVRETTQWFLAFAAFEEAQAVLMEQPPPTTTEPPTTSEPPPTTTEPEPTDTVPPSLPSNQQLVDITQTSARMTWEAATDNVGVTNYNVFLDNVRVAQPVGIEWTYSNLDCGRTYLVGLTAQDAAGNVSDIAQASGPFTTLACDEPPPTTTEPPTTTAPPPVGGTVQPGQSWSSACAAAAPGSTVLLAEGTHPSPLIEGCVKAVTFKPVQDANVVFSGTFVIRNSGGGLTVEGVRGALQQVDDVLNQRGVFVDNPSGITLRNLDVGNVGTLGGSGVTMVGGDYGPCHQHTSSPGQAGGVCDLNRVDGTKNVIYDGILFHDYLYTQSCKTAGTCHWRPMFVVGVDGFVLRRSVFRNFVFEPWSSIFGGASAIGNRNMLIENNYFGVSSLTPSGSGGGFSFAWCQNYSGSDAAYANVTYRFNSHARGAAVATPAANNLEGERNCRIRDFRVYGNIIGGRHPGCTNHPSVAYSHNVYIGNLGGVCGPGDVNVGGATIPWYLNDTQFPTIGDYALDEPFAGDNLVPADCPAADAVGKLRTVPCDAGAHER